MLKFAVLVVLLNTAGLGSTVYALDTVDANIGVIKPVVENNRIVDVLGRMGYLPAVAKALASSSKVAAKITARLNEFSNSSAPIDLKADDELKPITYFRGIGLDKLKDYDADSRLFYGPGPRTTDGQAEYPGVLFVSDLRSVAEFYAKFGNKPVQVILSIQIPQLFVEAAQADNTYTISKSWLEQIDIHSIAPFVVSMKTLN